MASSIIHPIPTLELQADKSTFTWLNDYGKLIRLIGYVWYIEGPSQKILVDAGGLPQYFSLTKPKQIGELGAGLDKLGIGFSDIDLIIVTHMHHDHIAEAKRFPKARFLVQEDELEFARKPHPSVASWWCPPHLFEGLKFEVVKGDYKISNEVTVLRTPGHSPGGQSISIKTAKGTAIIAGMCTYIENFAPSPPIKTPVVIPAHHVDPFATYDSMLRIKKMADIIIPLHAPDFEHKTSIP